MPELRNLTAQDKDRLVPIPRDELRRNAETITDNEYTRQVFKNLPLGRAILGPEFGGEQWTGPIDKAREYIEDETVFKDLPTESAQVFAYGLPGLAPIVTIANADWDSIGSAVDEGNYLDAVGRFLETGVPGVLDIFPLAKPDLAGVGMGLGNVAIYQALKHHANMEPKPELPKIEPKQKLKPSEDLMWELYRP